MPLPLLFAAAQAAPVVGQVGTGLVNAAGMFTAEDRARLNKLKRERARGMLGLSDEELARLREQTQEPVAAAQREARNRGVTGGSFADQAALTMAQDAASARQLAAGADAIAAAQERARQADEAAIEGLEDQKSARRRAVVSALLGGAVGGVQAASGIQSASKDAAAQAQYQADLLGAGYSSGNATDDDELLQFYTTGAF